MTLKGCHLWFDDGFMELNGRDLIIKSLGRDFLVFRCKATLNTAT